MANCRICKKNKSVYVIRKDHRGKDMIICREDWEKPQEHINIKGGE